MSQPKIILKIVKVINEKLEIAPEKDTAITISLWDFKDENGDLIPKMDLKKGLRRLEEDEKLFQSRNAQCLDKGGRFAGERIILKIDREKFKEFYEKHKQNIEQIEQLSVTDANEMVEFLDDEPALKFGNKKCALPPYKNEHFFCRATFELIYN